MPSKIPSKREQIYTEINRLVELRGAKPAKITKDDLNYFILKFAIAFAASKDMVRECFQNMIDVGDITLIDSHIEKTEAKK